MVRRNRGQYVLYWEARSGAMAVELLLEEIGADHERVAVDMAAGEHRTDAFLSLNPTGQIPALRLPEGEIIGESAAIILTLGERHPGALVPAPGEGDRPEFLRWLIYMAASPYMTFVQFNHPYRFLDDPSTHTALIDNARRRLLTQFSVLELRYPASRTSCHAAPARSISTSTCSSSSTTTSRRSSRAGRS
jgi:glutathione S-transferase